MPEADARPRSSLAHPPLVAYVLKAYPRASEPFIISEIHRLEHLGLPLRLFATKPAEPDDRVPRHAMVDAIAAAPEFLRPTGSVTATPLVPWLRTHLPAFRPALARVARRHPLGFVRVVGRLVRELERARRGAAGSRLRRSCVREFLHAVDLVDRLSATPSVRHLHAHYAHGATTVAWFASTITGLSFSFTGHAKDLYSHTANPAGGLKRKLDAARFALTCTESNRRMLEALSPGARVHCVYHGLNADFSELLRRHRRLPGEARAFRVLGVGRLVRKKGFDLLVEAAARVTRCGLPIDVRIIGSDGDHAATVRQLVKARGLEGVVTLVGPLDQRGLVEEYHRAQLFCLPCRVLEDGDRDGLPNVLMEAMACGTPVLTTGVSGIPEMVRHEENGLVVPADDVDALAEALTRAAREPLLLRRLGEAAQRTARERFDGDALARRLAALFEEAVA